MKSFIRKSVGLSAVAGAALCSLAFTYTETAQAQQRSLNHLGDLGVVPYYNVRAGSASGSYRSGLHLINTSQDAVSAVKVRYRRAYDSAEVLDFIVVLSPEDVWVGSAVDVGGQLTVETGDNSCTVPQFDGDNINGVASLTSPLPVEDPNYNLDGYLEVIGMAQMINDDPDNPLSSQNRFYQAALHDLNGIPGNCDIVRSHFAAAQVVDHDTTEDPVLNGDVEWFDHDEDLKVSWFIRNFEMGIEFGNNATHVEEFSDYAMLSSQDGADPFATNFPNLDGGNPELDNPENDTTGLYPGFRDALPNADSLNSMLNHWSFNPANGVAVDWVVTFPGLYTYYAPSAADPVFSSNDDPVFDGYLAASAGDDVPPLGIPFNRSIWDREEQPASTVPSPVPPNTFDWEVNVIHWGVEGASIPYVFESETEGSFVLDDLEGAVFGWAEFTVGGWAPPGTDHETVYPPYLANAFWARNFGDPQTNYGRVVEHSYHSRNPR